VTEPERVHNAEGGYFFLPGIRAFSGGAAADDDHEIVRVRTRRRVVDLPDLVRSELDRHARPASALCSVELRSPQPMTWDEFESFNEPYATMLDDLGVTIDGTNPVARTNVVPVAGAPEDSIVHAVAFTVPRAPGRRRTYVIAGAAEVAGDSAANVVRPGDTSAEAITSKVRFVLDRMTERMAALAVDRDELATAHVYTEHPLGPELCAEIGRVTGDADGGFVLHPARPPIAGLEFEMDMRSIAYQELA
jgi:hypothetical protein